jgi:hypothetical protein
LRYPRRRGDNPRLHIVSQLLFKQIHDGPEGPAAIMVLQMLRVLQQKYWQLVMHQVLREIMKRKPSQKSSDSWLRRSIRRVYILGGVYQVTLAK